MLHFSFAYMFFRPANFVSALHPLPFPLTDSFTTVSAQSDSTRPTKSTAQPQSPEPPLSPPPIECYTAFPLPPLHSTLLHCHQTHTFQSLSLYPLPSPYLYFTPSHAMTSHPIPHHPIRHLALSSQCCCRELRFDSPVSVPPRLDHAVRTCIITVRIAESKEEKEQKHRRNQRIERNKKRQGIKGKKE